MKYLKLYEEYSDSDEAMRRLSVAIEILDIMDAKDNTYESDDNAEYQSGSKSLIYDGETDVLIYYNEANNDEFTTDWPLNDDEWDKLKELFSK